MSTRQPTLDICIVNYNTCDDLRQCLKSVLVSDTSLDIQVWVVDNASSDGSSDMVESQFPDVALIKSDENLGFSAANNLVLRRSGAPYLLLLNPDTVVSNGVFDETISFLQKESDVGMVSCRLVQGDGSLDLACRRSFPTAFDGFCRASGLAALFPRSRWLARYNLTYLDENATVDVDAINGAFMMVRAAAIEEVGFLDEDFFMYMEDIDWCYRFKQHGWRVVYLPTCTVTHLKGRSSRQNSERMVREFFRSMELFYAKHNRHRKTALGYGLTLLGVRAWMGTVLWRNRILRTPQVRP